MIDKTSIKIAPLRESRFIKLRQISYLENGVEKRWDIAQSLDSVMILIFNADSQSFVLVRQFRPAVFLRNNDGYMFELCAGLVDKSGKSVEEIAAEEVFEECGFKVAPSDLQKIAEFYSSVGTSGSKQTLFFCEVRNAQKLANGGGIDDEFIEIIDVPLDSALAFLENPNITPSLAFGFSWFMLHKKGAK